MKLKLLTAILMTLAAIAWLASALIIPAGQDTAMRWLIAVAFAGLAVFYWLSYFRMKNTHSSGIE